MDILTQGLLGGVLAQSGARPNETRLATAIGFAAGLLADADALIRSSSDPLLTIEYHRHFTHSLFFVPLGALIAALILWPFVRNHLPFARLYLFSLLGYSLSGFLDACTSYGTYWLWPLLDERLSFNIISIVDPVFTLVLLVAMGISLKRRTRMAAVLGLILAGAYLLLGLAQHQRAESAAIDLATSRGHSVERLVIKPTLGNLILWRAVYRTEGWFYVSAVRVGPLSPPRLYPGDEIQAFMPERDIPSLARESVHYQDILRFIDFSAGFVAYHPTIPEVLGDVRYSMMPTSAKPLWGISLHKTQPSRHVGYAFYREMSQAERKRFIAMLMGRDADE